MVTSIFVNLPTTDLDRATKFYSGLGWKINPPCSRARTPLAWSTTRISS
ncbi:hypothetical protein [Cryobacterium algoritolerans]